MYIYNVPIAVNTHLAGDGMLSNGPVSRFIEELGVYRDREWKLFLVRPEFQRSVPAFSCISMSANRAQIHAYRGELISLLAPYDNYDAIGPRISSNRSCDGIVGTPITLTFLANRCYFFSLSPSFFSSFFLSLYFDSIRSTFFLRLSSFHGIIIIHNFCPVNGNTIRKNQFKNEETKIATARMRCNIFFDSWHYFNISGGLKEVVFPHSNRVLNVIKVVQVYLNIHTRDIALKLIVKSLSREIIFII